MVETTLTVLKQIIKTFQIQPAYFKLNPNYNHDSNPHKNYMNL